MIKKTFALSLLFALSNTSAVRANECTQNTCDVQTQCTECPETECSEACLEDTYKSIENAKNLTMSLEINKKDEESWAPLAECTYAMLATLKNETTKTIKIENMKSYMKQMYEMANELNVHGNLKLVASDEAASTTKAMSTMSLEDIITGNSISITCTIEKNCDDNCNAIQDIINHVKAMEETENDCSLECIEGMCDAATTLNGTMSIDVK